MKNSIVDDILYWNKYEDIKNNYDLTEQEFNDIVQEVNNILFNKDITIEEENTLYDEIDDRVRQRVNLY